MWGCFNFHRVEPKIVPFLSGMVHLQQLSPRALLLPFELTLASIVGTTLDDGVIKFLGCVFVHRVTILTLLYFGYPPSPGSLMEAQESSTKEKTAAMG